MRLSHGETQLAECLRQFQRQWQRCGEGWHDGTREEFRREHVDALVDNVERSVRAMTELSQILEKAIRQCR